MPPISLGAFNYVIDKYNFLGIKEAMAENLLDKFAKDNDLRVLEFIFTTFDCKAQRKIAINEIAMIIVKGRKGPDFIVDFDIHDFLQLSEIVCASLIKRKFEGWDSYLNCFYGWVSKNSEERSGTAVEILGMIDIRASEVLKMLESLSLSKRFQGFKLMFEKTLDYVIKRNSTTCQYGQITCSICDFGFTPPYHTATGCNGVHRCRYWNTGDHIPSGNCGLPLMSDDAYR
ncbi:hypothetical protein QYM36_017089 [Artemia franciscana]|uniref:Uncharacterized protein n=1 Tax=Artemia franciscana TaxID=6661 RepID=A0AA88KVD9_ARTSF|nr:hypothetical protein QYM36_017089 [Artemia franciscana]